MESLEGIMNWPLKFMKNDWFSKGDDVIEVHIYAKDVTDCDVNFQKDSLTILFQTSNKQFHDIHGPKSTDCNPTKFSYSIHTSASIIPEKCIFSVHKTRIQLKLFKETPIRWLSLETRKAITDRKKACGTDLQSPTEQRCNNLSDCNENREVKAQEMKDIQTEDRKEIPLNELPIVRECDRTEQSPRTANPQDSRGRKFCSSENMMLLGGKSTPFSKKAGDQESKADKETNTVCEPQAASAAKEVNIQKNLNRSLTPGLTGLENYANNCYMNVVIQVLANIPEIREYFVDDHFLNSLNTNNPMGSGGNVAKAFAEVIKALWSCERKSVVRPQALKNIMGKRHNLFMGFQQCDAQEFFATLLDNLHEDMNQGCKPERSNECGGKDDDGPSVGEKADTAWQDHFRRNDSVIVKMFHGQMVSRLTCQACRKVSTTYEACGQISLPIAMSKHYLHVFVFFRDPSRQPERVRLHVSSSHAQVWHLLNILERFVCIPANCMRAFQDCRGSLNAILDENAPISGIRNSKQVIVCEVKDEKEADVVSLPFRQHVVNQTKSGKCANCSKSQSDLETKLKRCTRCLYVAYCSRDCQCKHWGLHQRECRKGMRDSIGLPFFVTLRKQKLSFDALSVAAAQYASFSVSNAEKEADSSEGESDEKNRSLNMDSESVYRQTSQQADSEPEEKKQNNKCEGTLNSGAKPHENAPKSKELEKEENRRHSKAEGACNFSSSDDFIIKAFMKQDQEPVILSSDDFKSDVVLTASYFALEWQNNQVKEKDAKELCSSFKRVPASLPDDDGLDPDKATVEDCFSLFLEPERLHENDGWKCPKCKSVQAVKKEMALSYPPPILLVHFKRFTFASYGQKVTKSISYPICGLDLTPYIAEETRGVLTAAPVYDLIGVICHKGSMGIGHYTSMVRSLGQQGQTDIGWRYFDDDHVAKIDEDRVLDSSAYVLVYRMRGTPQDLKAAESPFSLVQTAEGKQDKAAMQSKSLGRHPSVDGRMKARSHSFSMENPASKDHPKLYTRKHDHDFVEKADSPQDDDVFTNTDISQRLSSETGGPSCSSSAHDDPPLKSHHLEGASAYHGLDESVDERLAPLLRDTSIENPKDSNIYLGSDEERGSGENRTSFDSRTRTIADGARERESYASSPEHLENTKKDELSDENEIRSVEHMAACSSELNTESDRVCRTPSEFENTDVTEDDID